MVLLLVLVIGLAIVLSWRLAQRSGQYDPAQLAQHRLVKPMLKLELDRPRSGRYHLHGNFLLETYKDTVMVRDDAGLLLDERAFHLERPVYIQDGSQGVLGDALFPAIMFFDAAGKTRVLNLDGTLALARYHPSGLWLILVEHSQGTPYLYLVNAKNGGLSDPLSLELSGDIVAMDVDEKASKVVLLILNTRGTEMQSRLRSYPIHRIQGPDGWTPQFQRQEAERAIEGYPELFAGLEVDAKEQLWAYGAKRLLKTNFDGVHEEQVYQFVSLAYFSSKPFPHLVAGLSDGRYAILRIKDDGSQEILQVLDLLPERFLPMDDRLLMTHGSSLWIFDPSKNKLKSLGEMDAEILELGMRNPTEVAVLTSKGLRVLRVPS